MEVAPLAARHGGSLALAELMAEGRIPETGMDVSALNNNHGDALFPKSLLPNSSDSAQVSHSSSLESLDSSPGSMLNHMGSEEPDDPDDGSTSCSEDSFEMSSTCSTRESPGHSPNRREGTSSSFTSGGTEYNSIAPTREGSAEKEPWKGPQTSISMDSFLLKDRIHHLRESVDELDTGLPNLDFDRLEQQLQSAAREREDDERRRLGEEVRRRLAMQVDSCAGPSPSISTRPNKSNLAMRLQTAMNLQVCYINEMSEASEANTSSDSDDECKLSKSRSFPCLKSRHREDPVVAELRHKAETGVELKPGERQRLLNAETSAVLHKSREAGERAVEGFRSTKSRASHVPRQSRQILSKLSSTQIQHILDLIQTAIATKNGELVHLLIERDTLHMEHDSLLVDIEDFQEHEADAEALDFKQLLDLQAGRREAPVYESPKPCAPQQPPLRRPTSLTTSGNALRNQRHSLLPTSSLNSAISQLSPSRILSNFRLFKR